VPGEVGQGGLKVLHLWRHSQKLRALQPKNFFECRLEGLPCLLNLWTALYHFRCPSSVCAKAYAIRLFWRKYRQKQLEAKVLITKYNWKSPPSLKLAGWICPWNIYIYVVQTSSNRVILLVDLCCCLLQQCEALHACCSGFPIVTIDLVQKQMNIFVWNLLRTSVLTVETLC